MKRASLFGPNSGRPIGRLPAGFARHFWKRVEKTRNCWFWRRALNPGGYGAVSVPGFRGPVAAHRVSFALAHGHCPAGMVVMHRCDTPRCVRPAHLILATQRDNMRDARIKGRWIPRGAPKLLTCRLCGSPRDMNSVRALCSSHLAAAAARDRAILEGQRRVTQRFDMPFGEQELVARVGEMDAICMARNFGLYGFAPESCRAIGRDIGVCGERVRQRIARACTKLGVEYRTFWGHKLRGAA